MANTRRNPRDPDSPFITAEGMAKMRPFKERHPNMDTSVVIAVPDDSKPRRGSLSKARPAKQAAIRVSEDVLKELQATGPGWARLADDLLRAALKRRRTSARTAGA